MLHGSGVSATGIKPVREKLLMVLAIVLDCLEFRFVVGLPARSGYFRAVAVRRMPVALPGANACTSWAVRYAMRNRQDSIQINRAAPDKPALRETTRP